MSAYLSDGYLKEIYDRIRDGFINSIDPSVHASAYTGTHAEKSGFAEPEFAGKYLDTCMNFYRTKGDEKLLANARSVVESILANARGDGYLGCFIEGDEWKSFSVWNETFTVYGLASYYEVTGDRRALVAAEKCVRYIADHYMGDPSADILDASNFGTQNVSILLTLPKLYNLTKDKFYLDFAEFIFERLKKSRNNFFDFGNILWLDSRKGIENFIILLGMVMYGKETGKNESVEAAEKYAKVLAEKQIRSTGNGTKGELWTAGGNTPQFLSAAESPNETCVAVGWCELNALLFEITKDPRHIDAVEKALFNHILGSADEKVPDFAYYQQNYGKKVTRTPDGMYKCCRYRGLSTISMLDKFLFHVDNDDIYPLIYTNCVHECEGGSVTEKTDYPFGDTVSFIIGGNVRKRLRMRVPSFCKNVSVTCNGTPANVTETDGYITLENFSDGDVLTLDFGTELAIGRAEIGGRPYASYNYGHLLLVPDSHICKNIYGAKKCDLNFVRNENTDYGIEFDSDDLKLVDYMSAGKKDPNDEYTEWIAVNE